MGNETKNWLIFSRKWTNGKDTAVWYREKHKGYTTVLDDAGRYTEHEAKQTEQDCHGDVVAIPVSEVKGASYSVVSADTAFRLSRRDTMEL